MQQTTGTTELVCIRAGGERISVTLAIGHPYRTDAGDWACPIAIRGLHAKQFEIRGVDSLQAICLGIRMMREVLDGFVADGGRVVDPKTGDDFPLDAYFETKAEA